MPFWSTVHFNRRPVLVLVRRTSYRSAEVVMAEPSTRKVSAGCLKRRAAAAAQSFCPWGWPGCQGC